MKYLLPILLLALTVFESGCTGSQKKEGEFLIEGRITNYKGGKVYLAESTAAPQPPIDSTVVDDEGRFSFHGKAGKGLVFHIGMADNKAVPLVPEADNIKLEVDFKDVANYKLEGSVKSQILKDFTLQQARLYAAYIRNKRGLSLVNKQVDLEKWRAQEALADKALMDYRSYLRTFADTVFDPVLSAFSILSLNPDGNYYFLQEFLPEIRERGGASPYLDFADKKMAEIGEPFLRYEAENIATVNHKGDSIHLKDLRGKVVLLYFWASYCEFSRQENKRLAEAMAESGDENFAIFSYSIDESEKAWREAVEADQIPGIYHARGDNGWDSKPFNFFGVESVPTTFLLDHRGILRSKNVRADEIVDHLPDLIRKYGRVDGKDS